MSCPSDSACMVRAAGPGATVQGRGGYLPVAAVIHYRVSLSSVESCQRRQVKSRRPSDLMILIAYASSPADSASPLNRPRETVSDSDAPPTTRWHCGDAGIFFDMFGKQTKWRWRVGVLLVLESRLRIFFGQTVCVIGAVLTVLAAPVRHSCLHTVRHNVSRTLEIFWQCAIHIYCLLYLPSVGEDTPKAIRPPRAS